MSRAASAAARARALRELPLAVFVRDFEGCVLEWNNAAEALFGWSQAELMRRPLPFVSADDCDLLARLDEQLLGGEAWVGQEVRAQTSDGRPLEITLSGSPIRDELGRVVGSLGLARELTAERLAEREYGHFFELSPDLLCIADFEGRFHRLSPAWERMLGQTIEELSAQPFLAFVHPDDRERTVAETARLTADPTPQVLVNRYRANDGRYRWLQWIATSDLQRRLIYAIARDVTELKQTEEQLVRSQEAAERANRAKSEFLSRVSHELRTPLNAILGFGQLLEMDDGLSETQVDSVRQIVKGGWHLLQLIDEVLDISRIESSRLALSLEAVDVDELLEEMRALIVPFADERGVTVHAARKARVHVWADQQRLKQVLLNLLSNAVKYNQDGGEVRVGCDAETDGRFRITVTDTGCGVAEEQIERLFAPFDRLDAAERGIAGTGLGLALTKGLVEAMGGTIGVDSRPGEGSSFWVELPYAEAPLEAAAAAPARDGFALSATGRQTILYIEDNVSNLKLIERILAGSGEIRLLSAMQGQLGIDLAREHRPDLILLDLHLPDMNGENVLARLAEDERTRTIPVIVISADATSGRLEQLLEAGARSYLTKPLVMHSFIAAVEDALGADR